MNVKLDKFETGWVGLGIALDSNEIDSLRQLLGKLQSGDLGHFHFRCDDFSAGEGVADIEISIMGPNEPHNMLLDGAPPIWPR